LIEHLASLPIQKAPVLSGIGALSFRERLFMDTETNSTPSIHELQAGHVLCAFCSQLFLQSPTAQMLERLVDQRALLLEDPFSSLAPEAAQALYKELDAIQDGDTRDAFLKTVSQDYTYLFYMIGASHTSPYESVYRTDDRTLFGPTTLEVRDTYRAYGLQADEQGSQPDDHIGLELLFLSQLFAQAAQALEEGNVKLVEGTLEDIRSFLGEHLLVFAPVYLKNLRIRSESTFYCSVAAIMEAALVAFSQALEVEAAIVIDAKAYLLSE
jgi:TorA maturation chaperone TorD